MTKTGATRYQKFLKSEKSKTKLKAKDLPKGTNVTKTNFKVRKIIIKEQLKPHEANEILSKRKLNIKELLTRLNHFNVNSISEGICGLKEILTNHNEVLEHKLGDLIKGVTPLVLNVERIVRHESFKLLHQILSSCNNDKVQPFNDILCSYLRCAMTHIDIRIQEDSLLFLDVLLSCTPNTIVSNFHKILPNFMDMISKLRQDSKQQRTLTVNLNSKLTSSRWRVKVLYRLQQFLKLFVENVKSQKTQKSREIITKYYNCETNNIFPLYNPIRFESCCDMPNNTTIFDESEKLKCYIETLMPLLFETWIEANINPSSKSKQIETVLSEESATLLKHLIDILLLICDYMFHLQSDNHELIKWYSNKYNSEFNIHFMECFPYIMSTRNARNKIHHDIFDDPIKDTKMVLENLKLCNLYVYTNFVISKKNFNDVARILDYIEKVFTQNADSSNEKIIMKVLSNLFNGNFHNWTKNQQTLKSLLEKIIWAYTNKILTVYQKQEIFSLLCSILLNDKLSQFHKIQSLVEWVTNISEILLGDSVSITAVNTLHRLATQNNKLFNDVMKPNLVKILQNLSKLRVLGDSVVTFKLYSILYWIKVWDEESLCILESEIANGNFDEDHARYIMDLLKIKSDKSYLGGAN